MNRRNKGRAGPAGRRRFRVRAEVTVLFADCDPMGHCNNARFFSYMEYARVQYYKKLKALDLRKMRGDSPFAFIVAHASCDFKAPAYMDERLVVALGVSEIGRTSYTMEYEIREKKSRRLVALGHTVQVMFNYRQQKSFPIPASLRRRLERFEGRPLSGR